jgi:protease I
MMPHLKDVKVAILVEDGFEQVELTGALKALGLALAESKVVSPKRSKCAPGTSHSGIVPTHRISSPSSCRAAS